LAKLQTLKQNTEPAVNDENDHKHSKESVSTQTPGRNRMTVPLSSSNQTLVSYITLKMLSLSINKNMYVICVHNKLNIDI